MSRILSASFVPALLAILALAPSASAQTDAKPANRVEWEGWKFNWSVRKREALVLTDVSFRGKSVLKYAGLAELLTAYDQGEPRPRDFEQGYEVITLKPGVDCSSGESCKVFNVDGKESGKDAQAQVMMHEERTGPNYLGGFGRTPGKTLVLWMALRFTGGEDGYTFLVRWKFRDDGMLIPEVGATGVPQFLATGDSSPTGALIGLKGKDKEKVFAPSHIHGFLYRLHFAIDGDENTVEEFNWDGDPKSGTAKCAWTPILKETGRPGNRDTFRSWRVVNYKSKNALGLPRSYQLIPGATGVFRSAKKDEATAKKDLWVTAFKPGETGGMDDLARYANDEPVKDKSVVVWYWLMMHHMPRAEDYLHQPIIWKSFELMPRDFLDTSPLIPGKK
ncbi:MAG: hypothetical protein U0793_14430 [Gemmataceae bacterium]